METGRGTGLGRPVLAALVVVVAVVVAAVFLLLRGDADEAVAGDEVAAATAAEPESAAAGGTVGEDGLLLENAAGVVVDIAAGVLPVGATVEIAAAATPPLPEGVTPVGEFFRVAASAEFDDLVTVRLPIPAGTDTEGLALYKIDADGELSIYSGELENGEYTVGVLGFSTFGLGHGRWTACTRLSGWNKRAEVEELLSLTFSVKASVLCTGAVGPFHVEYSFSDSDEVGETVLDGLGATLSFSHQFRKPGRHWIAWSRPIGRPASGAS